MIVSESTSGGQANKKGQAKACLGAQQTRRVCGVKWRGGDGLLEPPREMFRYKIDKARLKNRIVEQGFSNLSQFSHASGLNRSTLHHYLEGKGPFSESYYKLCEMLEVDPLELLTPLSPSPLGSPVSEILPLTKMLTQKIPRLAVVLLGSRARGNFRKYSDWDLGITGGVQNLTSEEYLHLKNWVEDEVDRLNLPRSVDLLNLDEAPAWFLKEITYDPLFLGGNKASWNFFLGALRENQRRKQA